MAKRQKKKKKKTNNGKKKKKKKEWEMKLTTPALPPFLHQKKSIKKEVKFRKKQQIFT